MKILRLWRFYVASCIETNHKIAAKFVFSRWIFMICTTVRNFLFTMLLQKKRRMQEANSSPYIALVRENMVL